MAPVSCSACGKEEPGGKRLLFFGKFPALCSQCGNVYCGSCFSAMDRVPVTSRRGWWWALLGWLFQSSARVCRNCGNGMESPRVYFG